MAPRINKFDDTSYMHINVEVCHKSDIKFSKMKTGLNTCVFCKTFQL